MKVLTTAKPGTPEWMAARRGKIGGSDAAAILLGHRPDVRIPGEAKTPLGVWERLRAELAGVPVREEREAEEPEEDEGKGPSLARILRWGQRSEPMHLEELGEDTGWTFSEGPGLIQHGELDWIAGTPDAGVQRKDWPDGVVELKAPAFAWTRKEWTRGVPMAYQVQAALYMILWQRQWSLVSSYSPPSAPLWGVVPLAPQVEDWILTGLTRFWENNVLADIPPAPVNERDYDVARRLFERETAGKIVTLSAEAVTASLRIEELSAQRKAADDEIKALKAQIILELGDANWGEVAQGYVWRYAMQGVGIGKSEIVKMLREAGHADAAELVELAEKKTRVLKKMNGVK